MSDNRYHVGLGIFGIYAGTLKKEGEWKNKDEVTREAIDAVAGYLLEHKKEVRFTYRDKKYVMRVEEIAEGEE